MVDYIREGETGWLNDSCSADGLAAILTRLLEDPAQVAETSRRVLAARAELVKPLDAHALEMEGIYREAIAAAGAHAQR
jgi:hypothetical protein